MVTVGDCGENRAQRFVLWHRGSFELLLMQVNIILKLQGPVCMFSAI